MRSKRIPAKHAETKLERVALRWLNERSGDYENGAAGAARDLFYGGCMSGTVGNLIYHGDTTAFYRKHREAIGALLSEACANSGLQPGELLRDFDKEDPLALEAFDLRQRQLRETIALLDSDRGQAYLDSVRRRGEPRRFVADELRIARAGLVEVAR